MVVGGAAHKNTGHAIGRCRDTRHKIPRTVEKKNTVRPKPLHQAWTLNGFILLIIDSDAVLVDDPGALAAGRGITLSGYRETIQVQREPWRAEA